MHLSLPPCVLYLSPSFPPWFNHPSIIVWSMQIINFLKTKMFLPPATSFSQAKETFYWLQWLCLAEDPLPVALVLTKNLFKSVTFRNTFVFYGEGLSTPHPTTNLGTTLLAACDGSFNNWQNTQYCFWPLWLSVSFTGQLLHGNVTLNTTGTGFVYKITQWLQWLTNQVSCWQIFWSIYRQIVIHQRFFYQENNFYVLPDISGEGSKFGRARDTENSALVYSVSWHIHRKCNKSYIHVN
jgi:hypothetical protein